MTSTLDLDTVRSALVDRRKRLGAPEQLTVLPTATAAHGAIDVLWSQRRVQDYGALSRVEIPLAGDLDALPSCRALALELERRWVQRRTLGSGPAPTSVAVELIRTVGSARLVLLVTGRGLVVQHPPVAVAIARDIRAAIRRCSTQPLRTTPEMRVLVGGSSAPGA